jgi:hypothetical protein
MPRQSRIDAPGALHHVLIRGIERRKIFRDDADRENFVERLGRILTETLTVPATAGHWSPTMFTFFEKRRGEKISRDQAITLTDA